jgi:hypothetical protein
MSLSIKQSARIGLERRIEIADEKSRTVLMVALFEAVEPLPGFGISRPSHHEGDPQSKARLQLSHQVREQIIERTVGVPLFIEGLTKTV